MLLGNLHCRVTQKCRHLIDGHTSQQQIHGKGIAEAVRVPANDARAFKSLRHPSATIGNKPLLGNGDDSWPRTRDSTGQNVIAPMHSAEAAQ